ncbi:hypothetical protein GQX73_g1487 [Xylaria multiplex]|uniref:Uncharacterized protein n=1 Tax=Xylaria multiplex TaxID=323545 RepID=A0A7C8MRX4_9PEZI|nr:hypothetical protein GQX73_g1487 [Xylaria multiplex]
MYPQRTQGESSRKGSGKQRATAPLDNSREQPRNPFNTISNARPNEESGSLPSISIYVDACSDTETQPEEEQELEDTLHEPPCRLIHKRRPPSRIPLPVLRENHRADDPLTTTQSQLTSSSPNTVFRKLGEGMERTIARQKAWHAFPGASIPDHTYDNRYSSRVHDLVREEHTKYQLDRPDRRAELRHLRLTPMRSSTSPASIPDSTGGRSTPERPGGETPPLRHRRRRRAFRCIGARDVARVEQGEGDVKAKPRALAYSGKTHVYVDPVRRTPGRTGREDAV